MDNSSGNGQLRLSVLGTGYLGITHAACMASLGFEVLGVDTDAGKVDKLNAGQLPIYEPGLGKLLRSGLDSGHLTFTTSYPRASAFGDVHFICAGTPPQPGSHRADLSQVDGCVGALAPLLDRPCLVVGKSTVPVGTARRLAAELARACPEAELAWNPEFLREGSAVADSLSPDRIVAGVTSSWAEGILRQVYAHPIANGSLFITAGLETAELAKAAANAFLATKISFINAMAEVCEAAGRYVQVLSRILGADSRIGPAFLRPGFGFGGGCLPRISECSSPEPLIWTPTRHLVSYARSTPLTYGGGSGPPISPVRWSAEISLTCQYACSARRSSPVPTTCEIPRPSMWRRSCMAWVRR